MSQRNQLLELAIENILMQLVKEDTRFSASELPSRFDIILNKEHATIKDLKYTSPMGEK